MTCAPDGGTLAVDAMRRDAAIAMLAAAVARGEAVTLALEGESMRPGLPAGTRLHVSRTSDPVTGDLLVYRAGGRLVCHRLLVRRRARDGWRALMAGDARPRAVTWVDARDVLGRVHAVEAPDVRRLDTALARVAAWLRVTRMLGSMLAARLATRLVARLRVRVSRRPAGAA
jgi:hypothetical protein